MSRRIALSFGHFDGFTAQHSQTLRMAFAGSDELIVAVATDPCAQRLGFGMMQTFAERKSIVAHCRYVDRVIALNDLAQLRSDIVNYDISTLVLGTDMQIDNRDLHDIAQICGLMGKENLITPLQYAS